MAQLYMISEDLLQNGILLIVRLVIVSTVYIHMLKHFQDIGSYAKFNGISTTSAHVVLLLRSLLATTVAIGIFIEGATLGLIIIFVTSILLHTLRWKSPFSADSGGWEYSVLLLSLCLVIFAFGAGDFVAAEL